MPSPRAPDEPAPDNQHIAFDVGPGQEVERGIDDSDVAPHPAPEPERAAEQREPAGELAAGRKADVALHPRGGGIVVEVEQLGHDPGRRPAAHHGGIARREIGVDDDHAVLRPGERGDREQDEKAAEQVSHADLG